MNIVAAFSCVLIIGRGPDALGLFGRIFMLALSILAGFAAFAPGTQVGGRHGRGPSVPINTTGRVIVFLIAIVLFLVALGILK